MKVRTESWPRPHRLTVAEYYRMAEVGLLAQDARVELIEGEIVDMAPIGSRHAAAVNFLAERLLNAVHGSALVSIQAPVRLGERSEPQPDLAVLRPRSDRYANGHPMNADVLLIVEVSDTTLQFDRDVKSRLYAEHLIPELWIVDVNEQRVHRCLDPQQGEYATRSTLDAGLLDVRALGVDVDLSSLFSS